MLLQPSRTLLTFHPACLVVPLLSLVLTACGGGGKDPAAPASEPIPSASDREAPVMLAQTLERDELGQALLTSSPQGLPQVRIYANAKDDQAVTAYCLTQSRSPPAASDPCFGETRTWEVPIGPAWRAWARDAAGNVSAGVLSPGPCSAAAYAASDASSLPTVCMMTDRGEIVLELENSKASNTVNNFLSYVQESFYSGTVFHRVVPGTVLQGGGFTRLEDVPTNSGKPNSRSPIALEKTTTTGLSNVERSIAMARTNQPDSATSQFFINLKNNASAFDTTATQDGYAVFGRVIHGFEAAVLPLAAVPLGGAKGDLPLQALYLQWAYVMK